MEKKVKVKIVKEIGVLAEKTKGWKKEFNLVSWYDGAPKYEVRDWNEDHTQSGKGSTMTMEEAKALLPLLQAELE